MKIYRKLKSVFDQKLLAKQLKITNLNYYFDQDFFKNKVFKKPWGYEFLIFSNDFVSIIILFLNSYGSTSFHCHPRKKTSITVLKGKIQIDLTNKSHILYKNSSMDLGKNIFHKSSNLSKNNCILMEIETPTLKEDLLRYKDSYRRSISGYDLYNFDKLEKKTLNKIGIYKINDKKFKLNESLTLEYLNIRNIEEYYSIKKRYSDKKTMLMPINKGKKIDNSKTLFSLNKITDIKMKSLMIKENIFLIIGKEKT